MATLNMNVNNREQVLSKRPRKKEVGYRNFTTHAALKGTGVPKKKKTLTFFFQSRSSEPWWLMSSRQRILENIAKLRSIERWWVFFFCVDFYCAVKNGTWKTWTWLLKTQDLENPPKKIISTIYVYEALVLWSFDFLEIDKSNFQIIFWFAMLKSCWIEMRLQQTVDEVQVSGQ